VRRVGDQHERASDQGADDLGDGDQRGQGEDGGERAAVPPGGGEPVLV
jgi:hypothetical protein